MPTIDQRAALGVLRKPRVLEIAGALGLGLPGHWLKSEIVDAIAASPRAPLPRILPLLRRDELKAICRAAGIDDSGREKAAIADRLLGRSMAGGFDTLTRAELIETIIAATGLLRQDAEMIVAVVLDTMVEALQDGSPIEIRGFGSFRHRDRAARNGRNPATGETIKVPAKRVSYFKPGKVLKELLNP